MARTDSFAKSSWVLTLAAVAVVVAALYWARSVLIPLTLAVLLSFLLAPLCDWLERLKLGRIPSVAVTALFAFSVIAVIGWTMALQVADLAQKLPDYTENVEAKLHTFNGYVRGAITRVTQTKEQIDQQFADAKSETTTESEVSRTERSYLVRLDQSSASPLLVAGRAFGSLLGFLGTAGVVVVFVIFFLIRREDLRDRFIRVVGYGKLTVTTQAIGDAADRVSRYLLTQLFINSTYGIPVAVGLYFIGIPNAILWGVLAMVLRFIPYLGPWIAARLPIALSLAISPGWMEPVLTVCMFIVLELFSNNVMEPWLYGRRTGVSPVAVLVAAVFWTWLWGPAGLLLATPLTVCLVVSGKHVPQLSFLNILFGDEPVFEPKVHVYQRLLAGDQEEAMELVEHALQKRPLVDVYDTVLVPVLAMAEQDRRRGQLDDDQHNYILQCLREMIDEFGEKQDSAVDCPAHSVLCLPARDEADAIAATMLAQIFQRNGWHAETVPSTPLASGMLAHVAEYQPNVVCISAMPPAAVPHARYLCKQLLARFPDANVVVGVWNHSGGLVRAKEKLGCDDSARLAATFADAQAEARRLAEPRLITSSGMEK